MQNQGLAASITGPGTLGIVNGTGTNQATVAVAPTGRNISVAAGTNGSSYNVTVFPDGNAGISTITIVSGTTPIATKTVTFVGSPAKATATQGLFVLEAGSSTPGTGAGAALSATADAATNVSNTSAITAKVVDANGNAANGTVKIVSSNPAVLNAVGCTQVTATPGTYQCDVQGASGAASGASATITFEVADTSGNYTILAAPLTFAIGGAIASEALTTDMASYASLAPITLTVTAKDSAGNAAYDQYVSGGLTSALVASTQLGGAALTTASFTNLVNGVATVTGLYAPAVAGDFTVSGTDAVSTALEAISVTANSTGGSADASANAATDAANEATDAANAATDAANAAADSADAATQAAQDAGDKADAALAAVTALSQQVTTLLSKVAALATAIAKITKKLKA